MTWRRGIRSHILRLRAIFVILSGRTMHPEDHFPGPLRAGEGPATAPDGGAAGAGRSNRIRPDSPFLPPPPPGWEARDSPAPGVPATGRARRTKAPIAPGSTTAQSRRDVREDPRTMVDTKSVKKAIKRVVPRPLWMRMRRAKRSVHRARDRSIQSLFGLLGFAVTRSDDYYSPLPTVPQLKAKMDRWNRPSALVGVQYDLEAMKRELTGLLARYAAEFEELPPYREVSEQEFGPGYTQVDALTLYMMIRDAKPRRYIEVGSGMSTYYCSLAARKNASEGHPLQITCIEPHPYDTLFGIPGIEVIRKEVQDVDPSFFQSLEKDDILFIDSSHIIRIDGDVPFLYLEVLPSVRPGVLVHVHDVPFPYNIPYPPKMWLYDQIWPMLWNEAMLLQAFLCYNDRYQIVLSIPMLRHFDEGFLVEDLPHYEPIEKNPATFSSLWLRRVH